MRYYVIGDPHAHYKLLIKALKEAGWFAYAGDKKMIILGDIMDRGNEPKEMQDFITDLLKSNQLILISGNHECMAKKLIDCFTKINAEGLECSTYFYNGTVDTMLTLTNLSLNEAKRNPWLLMSKARATDYYNFIIPETKNYFETKHYIFIHGYIPVSEKNEYDPNWRKSSEEDWSNAKWLNGVECYRKGIVENGKVIVFGHRSAVLAREKLNANNASFNEDYTPFYSIINETGIVALDSCAIKSHFINCIIIEDEPVE